VNLRIAGFLAATLAGAFSVCALSKPQIGSALHKTSDLKVTIIPHKNIFSLHETVYTRVEFRNLGTKTYCFPKPSLDCTNDFPGSAVTNNSSATSTVVVHPGCQTQNQRLNRIGSYSHLAKCI
jgi:hypothetical protein